MEKAIRERRRSKQGIELPIECYRRRAPQRKAEQMATPHYHEHIELLYADGECDISVWIGGVETQIRQGDLIIINSNEPHTFRYGLPTNEYICVKVIPSMLYSSENSFLDMKYILPFLESRAVNFHVFGAEEVEEGVCEMFHTLLSEWDAKEYGYEMAVRGAITKIFLWAVRKKRSENGSKEESERIASGYNETLIHRSVEYIGANFADVTESDAAASVNMSCSHYSRQFKAVTGKSFCEYVNILRIGQAEKLLLTTAMPITDIALYCGFATSSHFIESFKKQKGTTPGKYRHFWAKRENIT